MSHTTELTDVNTLRKQARAHMEQGAVTAGYGADRDQVLKLLNDALATELVCVLRYRRHRVARCVVPTDPRDPVLRWNAPRTHRPCFLRGYRGP